MEWSPGSFGDLRLDKGGTILERMVARETVCLRRLAGNRGGELRAGRFFANPKVTAAKIVEGWGRQTDAAVTERHVLAIQACPREGGRYAAIWRRTIPAVSPPPNPM